MNFSVLNENKHVIKGMNFTDVLDLVPRDDIFCRTTHICEKHCVEVCFLCPAIRSLVLFQSNNLLSLLVEITGHSNQKILKLYMG